MSPIQQGINDLRLAVEQLGDRLNDLRFKLSPVLEHSEDLPPRKGAIDPSVKVPVSTRVIDQLAELEAECHSLTARIENLSSRVQV